MALKLLGIKKKYGTFTLEISELTFLDKSYTIVLGPSGSGKTTTLRIISGLETPEEGKIILDDKDITYDPPWKRDIGVVFQNYALYPHLTAYENIAVPLKVKKLDNKEIDRRIRKIADVLGITNELYKYPSQLSGGQQQRVAIARALVKEPKVLLLDEPLSNLDARLRLDVRSFLKELQKKLEMTVIHVTHDQEEAMAIADNIVLLNNGRIIQVGTPNEIYRKPKNMFIFNFIGLSNIIPAHILGIHDADYVGFRPEDAIIKKNNEGIKAKVKRIQYLGAYKLIELMIDNEIKIIVRTRPDENIQEEENVNITIPNNLLLKFKGEEALY
jgi:multiple sugar transport system ATP-binding protein